MRQEANTSHSFSQFILFFFVALKLYEKMEMRYGSFLTPMCKRLNNFRYLNGLLTLVLRTV